MAPWPACATGEATTEPVWVEVPSPGVGSAVTDGGVDFVDLGGKVMVRGESVLNGRGGVSPAAV